jgi:hypothetical protein
VGESGPASPVAGKAGPAGGGGQRLALSDCPPPVCERSPVCEQAVAQWRVGGDAAAGGGHVQVGQARAPVLAETECTWSGWVLARRDRVHPIYEG